MIVVDKPPLLLTLPTKEEHDSVQTRAADYLKEKFQKPGNVFVHPVHRLDKVASGIVVCARTSKSLSRLNEQIRDGHWHKLYKLRHEGILPSVQGTLRHFLQKDDYHTKVVADGQEAVLHYKQLIPGIVEVELVTGRYHQIRAQFSAIGCPICGDYKYGAVTKAISPGIDLYHIRLQFSHPVTKKMIDLSSLKVLC